MNNIDHWYLDNAEIVRDKVKQDKNLYEKAVQIYYLFFEPEEETSLNFIVGCLINNSDLLLELLEQSQFPKEIAADISETIDILLKKNFSLLDEN